MAKMNIDMPDDLIKQLEPLENISEIAPKALDKAAPIVERNMAKNLEGNRRTGDLINSIHADKVKVAADGWYKDIGFNGYDRNNVANDLKANVLEYGKKDQPAQPFLTKTANDSQDDVIAVMQNTIEEGAGID